MSDLLAGLNWFEELYCNRMEYWFGSGCLYAPKSDTVPSGPGWNIANIFSNLSVTKQLFGSHRLLAFIISKSPSLYGISFVKQRMQSVKRP